MIVLLMENTPTYFKLPKKLYDYTNLLFRFPIVTKCAQPGLKNKLDPKQTV